MSDSGDDANSQPTQRERALQRIVLRGLFDDPEQARAGGYLPLAPGVSILPLYGREPGGSEQSVFEPSAALLRYEPGASVPAHLHRGYEHIFVLQGSQRDDRGVYPRGTCVISPPRSQHAVTSDDGCLVLAIWNQAVEFIDV